MKLATLLSVAFATQITATSIAASVAASSDVCCKAEANIAFKAKKGQSAAAACKAAGGTLRKLTCNCENFCGS
ncbi:hypothetical protein BLS_001654 [Venturia inaequalis]|uniref:Uncharacterized protein n=1 Tax=Venturia inaequalis TaxID=5025 RepID=A0A8H3YYS2_VENIN|nr:hypothetical protein BLS_001654 [Venturia inaequalis]KAE9976853.1 hypothetical protein EG328_002381 [Venturia inaequalis]KAE9990324.1 hypothetical protein EG327_001558 [Venturia inaequalis]RDI77226.1 hypothetical protein Vi05172_g12804 [Venturia inaequalis]